jgi:hypothetical protein
LLVPSGFLVLFDFTIGPSPRSTFAHDHSPLPLTCK